jgi:hypothetical protein
MDIDRRQRARILEYNPNLRSEMEDGTRESGKRLRCRSDDPISVHAKVNVKDTAIVETNELVLPSPFDRAHSRTGERAQRTARQPSPQRWVQYAGTQQRLSFDRHAKKSRGAFDFGKLRHELSR